VGRTSYDFVSSAQFWKVNKYEEKSRAPLEIHEFSNDSPNNRFVKFDISLYVVGRKVQL